jgi:hypothetical protein
MIRRRLKTEQEKTVKIVVPGRRLGLVENKGFAD